MTALLIKLFVTDRYPKIDKQARAACGTLSGIVGVIVNLLLCSAKFIIGSMTGSISITADAANNLSDAGSSIVTLVSFKAAAKPDDEEHPFGHGRIEYISALIVAFLILIMGFELLKSSVTKIFSPEPVTYSTVALLVLILSMLGKLWLAYFNYKLGKKIDSPAVKAVVTDSLSDTAATAAAAASLVIANFTDFPADGYLGVAVSCFIFYAGINILRETLSPLLGQPAEKEFVEEIEAKILSYDGIVGVHDLIIHDYGPSRRFASAHAEVPADADIMRSHDIIDLIERDIRREFDMLISIHMDPIVVDDAHINALHEIAEQAAKSVDERLTIHDFRVVDGPTHTNLIFDVVAPRNLKLTDHEINNKICENLSKIDERYFAVITVEHAFHEI